MAGAIDDYMTQLERELSRRGIDDPRILAEAREHLVDAIEAGRQRGLSAADAEREGLDRFGAPGIVAAHMLEERKHMPGRFRTALGIAWQRKWWIAVPTVCTAIVAGVLSQFVMPPTYRAESVILVVPQRISGDYVRPTADMDAHIRHINSLVFSRTRLERVIEELDLYREERTQKSLIEVVDRMVRDIRVTAVQGGVFRLSFVSTDPRTAMQVTDRLASYLIEANVRDTETRVGVTGKFLDAQIDDVRRRLLEQEKSLDALRAASARGGNSQADLLPFDVLKDRYKTLLMQREDARVAENLERRQAGQQLRILDRARLAAGPDAPIWPPLTLLGALVGLLIGLTLAFLRPSGAAPPPPTLAEA